MNKNILLYFSIICAVTCYTEEGFNMYRVTLHIGFNMYRVTLHKGFNMYRVTLHKGFNMYRVTYV